MIIRNAKIYLCKPDRTPVAELNGKKIESVEYTPHLKDFNKLTFQVDRYIEIDGELLESSGYEQLNDHMLLYLEDLDYFQIQEPKLINNGKQEYKEIIAYSDEKSLDDKDLKGFLFNKGTKDSLEMLATNNVDELGFAKEYISFYNEKNKELSLLDLVLEKVPGWKIGHIDNVLKDMKVSLEAENTTVYAFLQNTVSSAVKCIFKYDTINRTINAYNKNSIGLDTNIFISSRNLLNSLRVEPKEDSIMNALYVQGDDELNIRNVNFGDPQIYNLDYYLTTQYFNQDTIDKIKRWIRWREDNRNVYVENSKKIAELDVKIDEILYRVPLDGCEISQWDEMDEDTLKENLQYYNKLIESLQISVDTRSESEMYDVPEDLQNRKYQPYKTTADEINHQIYLDALYKQLNGYGGYYIYLEVKNYILPNIQTALDNFRVPEDDKKEYNKDWETNWDLYGIKELEGKRDTFNNQIKEVLKDYKKPWNDLTDEEKSKLTCVESYYTQQHEVYAKYEGYLGDENTQGSVLHKLKELNDQVSLLQAEQDDLQNAINDLSEKAQLTHQQYGLTKDEYIAVNNVIREGDYTNNNILITSIDTAFTQYNAMEELYQDGCTKAIEAGQPQYTVSTEIDNLLDIAEYVNIEDAINAQNWYKDCVVGNFIRVGIRDDYAIKLRLLSYSYNPCTTSSTITVTYTNMINGKTGLDDFADLFDDAIATMKNAISVGVGNAKSDLQLTDEVLQMIVNSRIFSNSVNNTISNSTTLNEKIINELNNGTLNVKQIIGDEGDFQKLFSEYIDADYINTRVIISDTADFKNLSADIANIHQAILGTSSTETGLIFNLNANNATIDSAWIANLVAAQLSVGDLQAGDITVSDKMRILSENGNMVVNGSTMQFLNTDGEVGIQIGYGTSENPTIIVRDENGTLIMDSTGITKDAIADGLIVNNMIGENTIGKEKLNFPIIEPNEHGGVDITQIYDGNGNLFGVQYTQTIQEINRKIDDSVPYTMQFFASNGRFLSHGITETIISVRLFRGSIDVTDEFDDSHFIWKRESSDSSGDLYWTEQHANGTKNLKITRNDIFHGASFGCSFVVDGETLATKELK